MGRKEPTTSVAIKKEHLEKMDEIKEKFGFPKKLIINNALKEYFENHDFDAIDI